MFRKNVFSLLSIFTIISCLNQDYQCDFEYPKTKQVKESSILHGERVDDPYRWMEDMNTAEVKTWVQLQDSILKKFTHFVSNYQTLSDNIEKLQTYDLYSIPQKVQGKLYYTKTAKGEKDAVLWVDEMDTKESKAVFDPRNFFSEGGVEFKVTGNYSGFFVSPDGKKVALAISNPQSRWMDIIIKNTESDNTSMDRISNLHFITPDVVWDSASEGFFYIAYDKIDLGNEITETPKNARLMYHEIGNPQSMDSLIFEDEPENILEVSMGRDFEKLLIHSRKGSETENQVYLIDLTEKNWTPKPMFAKNASYTYLGNKGNDFWFYTNYNAPNGKVVKVDLENNSGTQTMMDIVPESSHPIMGSSLVGGNAIGMFNDTFLITYVEDGLPVIRSFDEKGREKFVTKLPLNGSLWGGFGGTQREETVFYQFLGFMQPSIIYGMNTNNGKVKEFKKSDIPIDSEKYITKRIFYTSKDGTQVPMFISHKRDLEFEGEAPTLIYAYGAFNWISFLWYQPHLIAWLEMGGIYAQPAIRGGGEFGEDWHKDGILTKRQNAIDDYVYACKWLIDNEYTNPQKLAANGGSASAPLVGAAVIQNPELFRSVVLDRPALDMIRYSKFTTANSWVEEFGDVSKEEEFATLYSYSPYHNIDNKVNYPPILLMVGDKDEVTPPLHSYKFIARLQSTENTKNPMLLKMMWGSGHNFGATVAQRVDSRTDQLAFLLKTMDLSYP